MALIDDLKIFYPSYTFNLATGQFTAIEHSAPKVTLNSVIFSKPNVQFTLLDMNLIKDSCSFYQKADHSNSKKHELFRKDCDGLAFYEDEAIKHLIAVELKSTFSTQDIFKAFSQVVGSIFKTILFLNPLATFDSVNYTYTGYICTHDHPNRTECLKLLRKQALVEQNKGSRYTEKIFAHRLYTLKKLDIAPSECLHLDGFNLSKIGIFRRLTINLEIVKSGSNKHNVVL